MQKNRLKLVAAWLVVAIGTILGAALFALRAAQHVAVGEATPTASSRDVGYPPYPRAANQRGRPRQPGGPPTQPDDSPTVEEIVGAYRDARLHRPGVECRTSPPASIGDIGGDATVSVEKGPPVGDNTLVGGWLLIGTPEGRGRVTLDLDDYEPATFEWERQAGEDLGRCWPDPIDLNPVLTVLFGIVHDEAGPVPNAFVTGCGRTSRTSDDGTWLLKVVPGPCSVMPWRDVNGITLAGPARRVDPHEGSDLELDLFLPGGPPGWAGLGLVQRGPSWVVASVDSDAALDAGIRVGDELEAVDGRSLYGIDRERIGLAMAGLPGEPISVSIRRGKERATLTWVRSARAIP